ncbi:hypothetical protein RUND412_008357 [Rhizina undulata]
MAFRARNRNELSRNLEFRRPMFVTPIRPINAGGVTDQQHLDFDRIWRATLCTERQPTDTLPLDFPGTFGQPHFFLLPRERSEYLAQLDRYRLVLDEVLQVVPMFQGGTTDAGWYRSIQAYLAEPRAATAENLRIVRVKHEISHRTRFASSPSKPRVYRDFHDTTLDASTSLSARSRHINYFPFPQYASGEISSGENRAVNPRARTNDPLLELFAEEMENDGMRFASPRSLL